MGLLHRPDALITGRAVAVAVALATTAARAELPRLTGVVIAPNQRVALFDTGEGRTTQVAEGEEMAGYHVRSIARDGVQLEQDGRIALLRTSPAKDPVVPIDIGGATFGRILRPQPPPDD